jgi:long-chain fatty acid transport protein
MKGVAWLTLFLALGASPALAAGYGLKEHSADAMSASYAGAAATGSDASYLAYNPAALGGVADTDISISLVPILPGSKGTYSAATTSAGSPTGGGANPSGLISNVAVPALAIRHRLSDRLTIGLSITAPWGLRTDYRSNWAGRYYAEKSELLTVNIMPAVAYQIVPAVTLAAGLQIEYAQGTLTSAIDTGTLGALNGIPGAVPGAQDSFARLSGNNWTFGYTVGAIVKPLPDLSVGIAYRSSLQHDLKGPLDFTLDGAGIGATIRSLTGLFQNSRQTTPLTMPDMITSGIREDFSGRWSGMIEVDWTHWSRVRQLMVIADNPAQPNDVTTLNWKDTIFGSAGFEYRASSALAFRAGAAYDQSPAPDATREPRIPDSDRIWLSAGVRYHMSHGLILDVTAAHLFSLKSAIALDPSIPGAALRGSLTGTAQFYVNVAGVELTWKPN